MWITTGSYASLQFKSPMRQDTSKTRVFSAFLRDLRCFFPLSIFPYAEFRHNNSSSLQAWCTFTGK